MASSSSSSSLSFVPGRREGWTYDVFLSFKGEDTSKNFVDRLYETLTLKGIHTFKDDNMCSGEQPISEELVKAIKESRFAVVVFSKNYAYSSWCLEELSNIMECQDQMGGQKKVLPVFYHVDPSDVRKHNGDFATAFETHEDKFKGEMDKVNKWRKALTAAANLSGQHVLPDHGDEAAFISKIVEEILAENHLIGIEPRIDALISLLKMEAPEEVRIVGIWGMGGIGKTTIARALFNRIAHKFEGSSFVKGVGRNSSSEKDMVILQERILNNILGERHGYLIDNLDQGANIIQERCCTKKVLLVLDDVNNVKQLEFLGASRECYGPGSRIIITTRDQQLLSHANANARYRPALLRTDQALELFSWHAFRKSSPPDGYMDLANCVINCTHRLPLALEVVGSFLCGREADMWESALDKLAKTPDVGVFDAVKFSFDYLNDFEKQIFLDIACFYKGEDVDKVTRILDSFGFDAVTMISVLVEKSLITISSNNRLDMHDIIQEMGREVVQASAPNSRLWELEKIHDLINNKELELIEGIVLPQKERKESLSADVFKSLKNLRVLDCYKNFTSSKPAFLPDGLRWLCWRKYPFSSLPIAHISKLVGLEMEYGKIKYLWKGKKIMLPNLKFINLHSCESLTRFPDVSGAPNIQSLNLSYCWNLVEVDESVGSLKKLLYLDMSYCYKLKCLPSILQMESLETLILCECYSLERIPEFSPCMVNLSKIDIRRSFKIEELPSSIKYLSNLSYLDLGGCIRLMNILEHLRIPFEDIKSATNNFSTTNCIGQGGFGKVYKGQLSLVLQGRLNTMVAVQLLDRAYGKGDPEFWKEFIIFSHYKHENLVSLVGFCAEEDGERIIVYEYPSNESLDLYLSSTGLSWNQCLRICIGAARGINHLHNSPITSQRVIHRDIKSSNVLLDQNWNAKIADFGLSRFAPANKQHTFLVSDTAGTMGYVDPIYMETGILTKESDVYSFGVVLFEVLCGRLSFQNTKDISRFLAVLVQKRYEENKLDTLVKTSIKEQISPNCFERFSRIAYQCLRPERQDRPLMTEIVQELEIALQYQEAYEKEESDSDDEDDFWETRLPQDWKVMITKFNIPRAIYTIKRDLFSLLHKGILFDEGNKFLWINNDGTKCVLISAKRFLELNEGNDHRWVFQHGSSSHLLSRFPVVVEYLYEKWNEIRCQIKTSILSFGTMYAANLVFKFSKKPNEDLKHLRLMTLRWKAQESSVYSTHYAELTGDNWYKIRMWNFVNQGPNADFDIEIEELSYYDNPVESGLLIQGIEFQPIEKMRHKEIKRIKSLLIRDEEDIDDDLYKHLNHPSKKELYILLCTGFLAYGGKMWLLLCKLTGGICSILPATHILCKDTSYESLETLSLSKSRFREVKKLGTDDWYLFTCRLRPFMFSPNYIYACYLVFKFGDNHVLSDNALAAPTRSSFHWARRDRIWSSIPKMQSRKFFKVEYKLGDKIQDTVFAHMNSTPPINIPTIMPKNDHGSHDSSNVPSIEGYGMPKGHMDLQNSWMEERNDGWMEVRLSKSLNQLENHVSLEVKLWKPEGGSFSGIIVEGIEFRPMQDVSNF